MLEKKISGLTEATDASASDEFVVVNKDVVEGQDASASGQTSKITLDNLKKSILGGGGSLDVTVEPISSGADKSPKKVLSLRRILTSRMFSKRN